VKNRLLGLAAAAVLLAFLLLWDQIPRLLSRGDRPGAPALPTADSYMNDTLTRGFDEDGRLAYRLTAERSSYFESRDQVVLAAPRLLAETGDGDGPWHLKANTGVLHNAERHVELHDQVVVWRDEPQGKNELRTSKLLYYPDSGRLWTDQAIVLRSPSSTTEAVGLDADLEQQIYRLLSQVRSVHQPQ
jgi:lipopolysaccharide export system protein LptC